MITELKVGRHTVRGASLGGMYTSLHVPELDAVFDVGVALRGAVSARRLFLSHAHVDHMGALASYLGMRGLAGVKRPLDLFLPAGIEHDLQASLDALSKLHRWPLTFVARPLHPGDEIELGNGRFVRAFKTFHPVPSLGYLLFDRVQKLDPAYAHLGGAEIKRRRQAGDTEIFFSEEHLRFAYATDTLPEVLDHTPDLRRVDTLVLECTFLDDRKSLEGARAGCHIHLDELLPRLSHLQIQHLVLMHFSQIYHPDQVRRLLAERLPPDLPFTVHAFTPEGTRWWN